MIYERLDKELRRDLDRMTTDAIEVAYGRGEIQTTYLGPVGTSWKPGEGEPTVVADSPAVAQAMGRCVASRVRFGVPGTKVGTLHPAKCGWCEYPTPILLRALDHAAYLARCVDREVEVWWFQDPSQETAAAAPYSRSTKRTGQYDHPEWRTFWSLPEADRAWQVARAVG